MTSTWTRKNTFTTRGSKKRKEPNPIIRSPRLISFSVLRNKLIFEMILYSYFILLIVLIGLKKNRDLKEMREGNKIKSFKFLVKE